MNSEVSKDTAKGEWLIYDDVAAGAPPPETVEEEVPWRILIVDDDVDVHVVTRFSLRNVHLSWASPETVSRLYCQGGVWRVA